jgi:class 3 adenylate cyclase
VLRDLVNVAQRLQAASKSVGATLVVSKNVKSAVGSASSWRDVKSVAIPGGKLPLDIAYV